MDIEWVNMTGQWPSPRGPVIVDMDMDGENEIVILNRYGQVLHWRLDGSKIGSGQDGMIIRLPEGEWSSRLTVVDSPSNIKLVACSVEGLVVALDGEFQIVWQNQLPGKTTWGYTTPAVIQMGSNPAFIFSDNSGTITCLDENGKTLWDYSTNAGKSLVAPATMLLNEEHAILVPIGSILFCLDRNGKEIWKRNFGETLSVIPTLLVTNSKSTIICGSKKGSVFGIDLKGNLEWKTNINDEVNAFISFLPREGDTPLIILTGLWGNLFAIDETGKIVWTHLYRAKGRGTPIIYDVDGDGDYEILLSTYAQHLYAFDEKGNMVDNILVNGSINSSPILLFDSANNRYDVLVTTASLLTYRLSPSQPKSPYNISNEAMNIHMEISSEDEKSVIVHNPNGAFINVNVRFKGADGIQKIKGCLTAQSGFEIPLHEISNNENCTVLATALNQKGNLLEEKSWNVSPKTVEDIEPNKLSAWTTAAYADFTGKNLTPSKNELQFGKDTVSVGPLYRDEIDQGAFIISSTKTEAVRVRITVKKPVRDDGLVFSGNIDLHEVIHTKTVNGELAADALPQLNSAGIITLPAQRSVKIWQKIDAHNAEPGIYKGEIRIISLDDPSDTLWLTLDINVLDLKMSKKYPLDVCTWDYIPNAWFPNDVEITLKDMADHGVNIFPRPSSYPKATVGEDGIMKYDYSKLDVELERLDGRGTILFHLVRPPITFVSSPNEEEKHKAGIEYYRAFKKYLDAKGWDVNKYAFYPLDEPGLKYGKNVPILVTAAELIREADPELRIYTDPVTTLCWQDFETIDPLIDVWCPNMRLVQGLLTGDPRMEQIMKSDEPIWSYECIGFVKSLSPLRYNRANAWRAKYFKLDGIGFWTYSTTGTDHWFGGNAVIDEYALVYPGDTPVPSVRWEAVRDGLEDITAITLLEQEIERNKKLGKKSGLIKSAEKAIKLAQVDIMELSDRAFIHGRDYLQKGDRRTWHSWSDIYMYQRHREDIARLTLALSKD